MEDAGAGGEAWSVGRRFRLTEVFLAVLWVCLCCAAYILRRGEVHWEMHIG